MNIINFFYFNESEALKKRKRRENVRSICLFTLFFVLVVVFCNEVNNKLDRY